MSSYSKFLLFTGIVGVFGVLSCNRHTTKTADNFNGPVAGDTMSFYPTMIATLIEDSVNGRDAYYYRINRVKRVESVDENSREVSEIDRFGHELTEVHYLDRELFWKFTNVYNRYGNLASCKHTFYEDDVTPGNVYVTQCKYEPDGWTLGQRETETVMICEYPGSREDKKYVYLFSYNGRFKDTETRFVDGKCTEKVYYTYNDFGKVRQLTTVEFKSSGPDTTIRNYKYDSLQREISWAEFHGGVLSEDHFTEYNAEGRVSKYTSISYNPYSTYVFEYFYLANGLLDQRIVTHDGKAETEKYRYAYYP